MKRHESAEDYLETILILERRLGSVRAIDIGNEMGFSKPSVSIAMKNLREQGLICVDTTIGIVFTEVGRRRAEHVYERHTVLSQALMALGVGEATAKADACRIEHDLSEETFACIKAHFEQKQKQK